MIYLDLLLGFLRVGCFAFGGAYGAIPLIRDVVLSYGWMDDDALAYMIAVSESTPGPIMVNLATYVGSSQAGLPGAILATLAARRRPGQKTLGFAAETAPDMEALMALARAKRARKDADLLAGNRINGEGSGFGSPTNSMAVTDRSGHGEIWPQQAKADVAWELLSWLLRL